MNLIYNEKKDSVNITFIREQLSRIYLKKDRTGFMNSLNTQDTINTLEEIGIITRVKKGKQEKIINVTSLGEDIQEFILNLGKYNNSYFNLFGSFAKKLLFIPASHLDLMNIGNNRLNSNDLGEFKEEIEDYRMKLIEFGWKTEEINLYNQIRTNLIDIKIICDRNFFNMSLARFAKIIKKHDVKNPLLLEFFGFLLKEPNEKKIDFVLSNYEMEINGYSNIRIVSPINAELKRELDVMQINMERRERIYPRLNEHVSVRGITGGEYQYFLDVYNIFCTNVISFSFEKEIKDMVLSYVELSEIRLGNYFEHIGHLKEIIRDLESVLNSKLTLNSAEKDKINMVIKTTKFFLNILVNYAKRKNMKIVSFF